MPVEIWISIIVSLIAAVTDWRTRKVRNVLVFPVCLAGVIWQFMGDGVSGVQNAVIGAAIPLVLFPLFVLRMLGAGDIKLLMALGAWLGLKDCGVLLVFSILFGGAMALGIMLINRNGKERLMKLWVYFKVCVISRKPLPYSDFTQLGKGEALPFAIAVLGGVLGLMGVEMGMVPTPF